MNRLRRIGILLYRDLGRGPRNMIFIFAIVVPVALTFLLSLLFGTFFSGKPRLGFADAGHSQLVPMSQALGSFTVYEYETDTALKAAVAEGRLDLGVVLPTELDEAIVNGREAELNVYIWGESLLKNRAILGFTLANLIREVAGQEVPVNIITRTLGDEDFIPWENRILPLIVLLAVVIGGSMVPSTSLVDEKQKRTLNALTVTPISLGEIFAAKALLGILLSVSMAVVVLFLNRAFGSQPLLLLGVLLMGATAVALFGILLGAFIKDINTLFAVMKGIGILLYAPALIYLIPAVPQWLAQIFPTYYIIQPVIELVQHGASLAEIAPELLILGLIIVVEIGIISMVIRRAYRYESVLAA